ncbi:MAG TPA: nickel-responsive transcriptional regulator NikR [Spirochaetota bacterium]|nr:nickel-responsive transcriptional regulator NikR [Spirochaetota bacterium]
MNKIIRFGVSLPEKLLKRFDKFIAREQYSSRSEAVRDLIREELVKQEWENSKSEITGTLTYVYDHHVRGLLNRITELQHSFQEIIISTQHIHIDHNNCLEIVAFRGNPQHARRLYNRMRSLKSVKHTAITMSSTGRGLA